MFSAVPRTYRVLPLSEYVNSDSDFANNGYGFEDEEGNQVSGDDLFEESDEPDDYGDGDEDL